jgi:hypothetical protein
MLMQGFPLAFLCIGAKFPLVVAENGFVREGGNGSVPPYIGAENCPNPEICACPGVQKNINVRAAAVMVAGARELG